MPDAVIERNITIGGVSTTSKKTYTDTAEISIVEAIADSTTDGPVALTMDVSKITAWFMVCDQVVLVETNSGSAPDESFTLDANVPMLWTDDDKSINPLATNITGLFITNSSGSTATFKFFVLYDAT